MDSKDIEYIKKEIDNMAKIGWQCKSIILTKNILDKLFLTHTEMVFSELWYDYWLDREDDGFYYDENGDYKEYTNDEWEEKIKNFDSRSFNNWIDEFSEGNFGITYTGIKEMIYNNFRHNKKYQYKEYKNDNRFYMFTKDNDVQIYFYGRDLKEQCDYWYLFFNREDTDKKCIKCKRRYCWNYKNCKKK